MIKNRHKSKFLIFFILVVIIVNIVVISSINPEIQNNDYNEYEKLNTPDVAAPLEYAAIIRNDSNVYRLFESVNFTVNASKFSDVDHVRMEISFSNGSIQTFNMNHIGDNNYSYEYIPGYKTPLGFHNVSFLIYNNTNTLLNDQTTYSNFTVHSNCMASFNSSRYYTGDTLFGELIVSNFSSSGSNFEFEDWDITVVDSDNEAVQTNLKDLNSNVNQFTLLIDNETFRDPTDIFYLKVNMTENNSNKVRAAYFNLNIRNAKPIITSIINLSSSEIFRTDDCSVSINVTDIETVVESLTVSMLVDDSESRRVLSEDLNYESGNSFSDTFSIPWNSPKGTYRINITATDEHGGIGWKATTLSVKNNFPEIHSYAINGISMNQSVSIDYGKNLVFSFNVSDIEGVSYIKLALINQNNEWFNISTNYNGEDTEITIRTIDLVSGTWFVYMYVIDSDGAITSLTDDYNMSAQGITIISDVLSYYISWIVFFFGLSIGVLAGIGIIYSYFKTKFSDLQAKAPKKEKVPTKQAATKKKDKSRPIKEELDEKEVEELKPEKEEEKDEGVPKRKIKRKL